MKIILCLFALMFAAAATNCGGTQATQIEQGALACASVDIGKTVPDIGMTIYQDVKTLIDAGKDGWETALEQLGLKYGADVLQCAIKAAFDALTAHPAGTMAPPPSPAALRAKKYMTAHNYKYAAP